MSVNNIFIWAPTQRCGTGLLQRLVTSSKEVLIFGEDKFLTDQLPSLMIEHSVLDNDIKTSTSKLASGDYNGWFPSALPFYEDYIEALSGSFNLISDAYSSTAKKLGFANWGSKLPYVSTVQLSAINTLLPNAKHIFLYRNLTDVMKSIKARRWVSDKEQFKNICNKWYNSLKEIGGAFIGVDWMYMLSHDQLIKDPSLYIRELENFLGLGALDIKVFEHKINTFIGEEKNGHSETSYVMPESLTEYEESLCQQVQNEVEKLKLFHFKQSI
jgi:hypothetical protein